MTVIIGGTGTANGISTFSSPATFQSTLATASGGITNASLPVGSLLQQYTTQLTAANIVLTSGSLVLITSSNSTEVQSFTITPVGTNSRFIFQMMSYADSTTISYHEQTGLFVGSSLLGSSWVYRRVSGTEPVFHGILGTYTTSGTGSFTLSYRAHTYGASPTIYFAKNATVASIPYSTLLVSEFKTQ